jgi:hypothetical protein
MKNTFQLIYSDNEKEKALNVHNKLITLLNKMCEDIVNNKEYIYAIMNPVAFKIDKMYYAYVGIGDKDTDNAICDYVEKQLNSYSQFSQQECTNMRENFYNLIHC